MKSKAEKQGRNSQRYIFSGRIFSQSIFLMFFYITSGVAKPFSLLAIIFSSVIFSAPGAEQLSCNVGVCWYCISVNKKIANLVGRSKLSEMDKDYLMIQGTLLGMESVNLI